jgi:hypothetical protein
MMIYEWEVGTKVDDEGMDRSKDVEQEAFSLS